MNNESRSVEITTENSSPMSVFANLALDKGDFTAILVDGYIKELKEQIKDAEAKKTALDVELDRSNKMFQNDCTTAAVETDEWVLFKRVVASVNGEVDPKKCISGNVVESNGRRKYTFTASYSDDNGITVSVKASADVSKKHDAYAETSERISKETEETMKKVVSLRQALRDAPVEKEREARVLIARSVAEKNPVYAGLLEKLSNTRQITG